MYDPCSQVGLCPLVEPPTIDFLLHDVHLSRRKSLHETLPVVGGLNSN
jgi:hypothetical protein